MSDLHALFIGEDNSWIFLLECALRAFLIFAFALVLMKITGKKEVRQFSILELLVVIGLGSALGDPMIYADSPLLPSVVAMGVVLGCYWGMNKWTHRSASVERIIEGQVRRILHEGILDLEALDAEGMSSAEFFGDLRVMQVEHLGQVKSAHMEIDGEVSIFFRADDDVRPGLPIAPGALQMGVPRSSHGAAACCCVRCGSLSEGLSAGSCPHCGGASWVQAVDFKRVS